MMAQVFSPTKKYLSGDYVYYNGMLYKFISDYGPGVWSSAVVTSPIDSIDDIDSIKQELSDSFAAKTFALNEASLGGYTVVDGLYINIGSSSTKIAQHSKIKLIVFKCKPATKYTFWKNTLTVFRVASGTKATPENTDVVTNIGANQTASTDPITGVTGSNDTYLYLQCWSSADTAEMREVEAHINSLVIKEEPADTESEGGLSDDWITHLNTKIAAINTIQNSLPVSGRSLHFIFFTDYHLETNDRNLEPIIKYLCDHTDAKYIINGGDNFSHPAEATRAAGIERLCQFKSDFPNIWNDINQIIGNHDWSTYEVASEYSEPPAHMLTLSHLANKWLVKNSSPIPNTNEFGDWYFDDDISSVRFILVGINYKANYEAGQIDWIAETLKDTPNDYDVIFVCHRFLSYNSGSGNHYIADANDPFLPHGTTADSRMATIANILTKYTNHQTIVRSGTTYDFTGKTGVVVMALAGHHHWDIVQWFDYTNQVNWYSSHSGTYIPAITVTCDTRSINYVPGLNRQSITQADYEAATKVTRSSLPVTDVRRHAFDDIIVDLDNRNIYLTRIGAGDDTVVAY